MKQWECLPSGVASTGWYRSRVSRGGAGIQMTRIALVLAAALALMACSNLARTLSYGTDWADAIFGVDGTRFEMYAHERDPTLLLQVSIGRAAAQGLLEGVSLGLANKGPAFAEWKSAAEWILTPVGCSIVDLYPLDQSHTWEVRYACPPGVDLRAMIGAQREQLRNGVPLDLAR